MTHIDSAGLRVVALSGGVGGARMVDGLARLLSIDDLTVVVNTGDDFEHLGLSICPDLDTVMYTLGGVGDAVRGWGLAEESFHTLAAVEKLGGPGWFRLGDRDLATHLVRTEGLRRGETLTRVTRTLMAAHGIEHTVLPMTDEARPTRVETADGAVLDFQIWFVLHRCAPRLRRIDLGPPGQASRDVLIALDAADLIVVTPSNPYVSIDPILALDGVRERIAAKPTVGVSPIVHGEAVKGPLADMIRTLADREPTAEAVADHYGDLVDGWVVEDGDGRGLGGRRHVETGTVMRDTESRVLLAQETLLLAECVVSELPEQESPW